MKDILSPERVEEVFMDCLFKEGEPVENYLLGPGIVRKVGFNPTRNVIVSLLQKCSTNFHQIFAPVMLAVEVAGAF